MTCWTSQKSLAISIPSPLIPVSCMKTTGWFIDLALKDKTERLSCVPGWPSSANWPALTNKTNLSRSAGEPRDSLIYKIQSESQDATAKKMSLVIPLWIPYELSSLLNMLFQSWNDVHSYKAVATTKYTFSEIPICSRTAHNLNSWAQMTYVTWIHTEGKISKLCKRASFLN